MTLPTTNLSVNSFNTEYGVANTTSRTLNDGQVRSLCKAPAGNSVDFGKAKGNAKFVGSFPSHTASINETSWVGTATMSGGNTANTASITACTYVSGSTGMSATINSPSAGRITFGRGTATDKTTVWQVTYSDGCTTTTSQCTVFLDYFKS